ncbi:MAG TPA: hypothetical protein VF445_04155 [Bordetella sp.]|uniref:hypothetical protein n=1 Tax=Bordetella sp. TaxID=28081 RepID=UPI002ED3DCC2
MEQVLLIKVPTRLGVLAAGRIRAALSEGLALSVDVCAAVEIEESYVYCRAQGDVQAVLQTARSRVATVCPPDSQVVSLEGMLHLRSEPDGIDAPWHYVVETDVTPESEQDFNDWYTREHMPGLAAVPGTARADRYLCRQGTPRYYACYDLRTRETFGSPPWLAVRGTDWSSRVRPSFRNTRRTMFARVLG